MIHYIVHNSDDSVGVIVVPEGIQAGDTLTGWNMSTGDTLSLLAASTVPVGHKVALREHKVDEGIMKYGHDIGRVVAPIAPGERVHVHNVKTRRW